MSQRRRVIITDFVAGSLDPEERILGDIATVEALNARITDLEITNRAKDYFLDQLKSERAELLERVTGQSRRLGELETRLQLNAGTSTSNLPAANPGPAEDVEPPPNSDETTESSSPPPDDKNPEARPNEGII